MPGTTITINSEQRDGLYELVRNHLGSVGDLFDALERDEDFVTCRERLRPKRSATNCLCGFGGKDAGNER